jgi:hypothetical protein
MSSRLRRDRSMWGIDELIQITAAKRAQPRLADRRIQIPGRRMPRFVPPTRKPRRSACNVRVAKDAEKASAERTVSGEKASGNGKASKGNTRKDLERRKQLEKGPKSVEEMTVQEFYGQL